MSKVGGSRAYSRFAVSRCRGGPSSRYPSPQPPFSLSAPFSPPPPLPPSRPDPSCAPQLRDMRLQPEYGSWPTSNQLGPIGSNAALPGVAVRSSVSGMFGSHPRATSVRGATATNRNSDFQGKELG
ncbi:hypothetical protein KM043_010917 [Ampulex compressa]|nr:hypothetical protein KM043_010917 [Ampulex compressa]